MTFVTSHPLLKKVLVLLVAPVAISCVFIGCDNKKSRVVEETPSLKAYRLIDEQRTDEAVALIEQELVNDPENLEYKSVLASAYAHKAGIKIQKLIPIVTQTERLKKLKDNYVDIKSGESMSVKLNSSALNISTFFIRISTVIDTYAAIPVLTGEEAMYLKHSISILNGLGKKITSDDVLYRAVLEVILFKYIFSENLVGDFVSPADAGNSNCRVDIGHLNKTLISLGKLLIDIFNDIGHVRPEQGPSLKELAQSTADAVSNLTLATTSIAIIDEASNILLKRTLFHQGLGKIVRCESR